MTTLNTNPATMTLVPTEVEFLNLLSSANYIQGACDCGDFNSQLLLDLPKAIVDGTLGTELVINNAIEANALYFLVETLNSELEKETLAFVKQFVVRTVSVTFFDPNQDFLNYDLRPNNEDDWCEMCGAYATKTIVDRNGNNHHYCQMCYDHD